MSVIIVMITPHFNMWIVIVVAQEIPRRTTLALRTETNLEIIKIILNAMYY